MTARNLRPDEDPRVERRARTEARIVREAWKLAARDGVAGISLGDLAKRVGMRQPSLYNYFGSKHELYDAMFADGNRQLQRYVTERSYPTDPDGAIREFVRAMVSFATADVARYHLLFQRHVPGFEPSAESYALAQEFYDWFLPMGRRAGIEKPADLDAFTALVSGLSDQQVANDPGGDRWIRLVDDMVQMFLDRLRDKGGFGR